MMKELLNVPTFIAKLKVGQQHQYSAIFSTVSLLVSREWQRMIIEPSRVIGMLVQPLLFLIVFGLGFHDNFYILGKNISYVEFFFPGILGLVILFSSIYATLTLVEDKRCGFFRLVMVGPCGVAGAIVGKIFATTILGFLQGVLFLLLSFFLPIEIGLITLVKASVFLFFGSLCFSLVGVLFAWLSPSSSAFHALMSVILLPMWLLSGAMFPITKGVLLWCTYINPMSYLVFGLRDCFFNTGGGNFLLGIIAFSLATLLVLIFTIKKKLLE